jgi:hypothetical protein
MTTITATEAYEAMLAHHKTLGEQLTGRADAVSGAAAAGRPYGAVVACSRRTPPRRTTSCCRRCSPATP